MHLHRTHALSWQADASALAYPASLRRCVVGEAHADASTREAASAWGNVELDSPPADTGVRVAEALTVERERIDLIGTPSSVYGKVRRNEQRAVLSYQTST